MKDYNKSLHMRGLRTPRLLLWLHGFFQGKVFRTAGLDPEDDTIVSGYVTGQLRRYDKACIVRCDAAEDRLEPVWAELDQKLIELKYVEARLAQLTIPQRAAGETGEQARRREEAIRQRSALTAQRLSVIETISAHTSTILTEENHTRNQIAATAQALLSCFSAYAHGLLMRPVYGRNLPAIVSDNYADRIYADHTATWKASQAVLKEVQSYGSV